MRDNLGQVLRNANASGFGDAWEDFYFGIGSNVVADADADLDGAGNWKEYLCGTDPTNAGSRLQMSGLDPGTNGMTIEWPVGPGRSYSVWTNGSLLITANWSLVTSPLEATNGQTQMQWTDTWRPGHRRRYYRIKLISP